MKDFSEVQNFIDQINTMEVYIWFKENFVPYYSENLKDKTMWVDYSSLIKGVSYDLDKSTLFITFVSDKSYAYYNVPVDVFVCGVFTDYLNELDNDDKLPKDFSRGSLSLGGWFNEMVKGYFDYTLLN